MTRGQIDGREALIGLGAVTAPLCHHFMEIKEAFGQALYELLPEEPDASLSLLHDHGLRKRVQMFDFDTFLQVRAHICGVEQLAHPAEELAGHVG